MKTLYYQDKIISLDPEGFLKDHKQWNEDIAELLAKNDNTTLNERHWFVIKLLRNFYQTYQHFPSMRVLIKILKDASPDFEINSSVLYTLFPKGPLKQGAKFAGLPKPPHCM